MPQNPGMPHASSSLATRLFAVAATLSFALAVACGTSDSSSASVSGPADGGSPEQTGQTCKAATDCYPGLEAGALKGAVQCLDRVTNGYCTHLCTTDADCCAVPGECRTGLKQVCAPFESTGQNMCFLSCEDSDLKSAPDAGPEAGTGADAYCHAFASTAFGCRSTGGGKNNRKVCLP